MVGRMGVRELTEVGVLGAVPRLKERRRWDLHDQKWSFGIGYWPKPDQFLPKVWFASGASWEYFSSERN